MQEYRAYIIGPDARITSRVDLLCEEDEAAQKQANQLVDGHDVELWQFGQVAMFPDVSNIDQR